MCMMLILLVSHQIIQPTFKLMKYFIILTLFLYSSHSWSASNFYDKALENFNGVARRFQVTSNLTLNGQAITLVDDYGHHPTEVEATIKAARESWPDQRVIMV